MTATARPLARPTFIPAQMMCLRPFHPRLGATSKAGRPRDEDVAGTR
jgi:hypothetical protein